MNHRFAASLIALSLLASSCGAPESTPPTTTDPATPTPSTATDTQAHIGIDGDDCTSSIPGSWPNGPIQIEISNQTANTGAVIMGTYNDGFGHADLVSYGRNISTRPGFIDALEIYEIAPESTDHVSFDHGPGHYFIVCMDSTSTMIVLNDLTVGS
jgi:hypothetical protein